MLRSRYGTFVGGLDLPDEKHDTLARPVRAAFVPQRLHVPLAYWPGPAATPVVRPGRHVSPGDLLASGDGWKTVDIYAPMAGVVGAPAGAAVAVADRFVTVPAIEMTALESGDPPASPAGPMDWQRASASALCDRLADGALTTFANPVRPLAAWLSEVRAAEISLLVINALEDQPYVSSDHRTLVEHGEDVLFGLAILARAIGASETALVVDQRRTDDYAHVLAPAEGHGVQLIALPPKYPSGAEAILLKMLTGVEVPLGRRAGDVGAAVIDPTTALAAARWVLRGKRTLTRILTLAGQQVLHPANLLAPVGTLCGELCQVTSVPLTHGGPMTGLQCPPGAVVTPATNAVLGLAAPAPAVPGPCIRCGWCTDHCPARLNVAALNDAFELVELDVAGRAGASACVDCGVCSYICPARLPLTHRVGQLKSALRRGGKPSRPAPEPTQ